eukprot:TRINITY_DN4796_c0_g1_i1.p1 TRINITY_DN4796_c0_g1~~TRINITY_DN4796_c0_g1_i1.p1  ORF type:complete len:425 (+),score=51.93 TRINITY_DN4796_c0_g1_i1:104-1276(+)
MATAIDRGSLETVPYIVIWLIFSTSLIFMNVEILKVMPYPAMLTAWHMAVSCICLWVLRLAGGTSSMIFTGACGPVIDAKTIGGKLLPVAACFALTLALGNRAYMHSSVSFIQMIKASHGPMTYIFSVFLGTESFLRSKFELTFLIGLGVVLSVTGELRFSSIGFVCQVFASITESSRVALIGLLLNRVGLRMSPLMALSYYAPLCFLLLLPFVALTEQPEDWAAWRHELESKVGYSWVVLNGLLAFALNVIVVLLIQRTSAIVYILCGIAKDIMIVVISVSCLSAPISFQQVVGYAVALGGIQIFNQVGKRTMEFEKHGTLRATLGLLQQLVFPSKRVHFCGDGGDISNGTGIGTSKNGSVTVTDLPATCNNGLVVSSVSSVNQRKASC